MVALNGNLAVNLEGGFAPMTGEPNLLFLVSEAVSGGFSFVESDEYDVTETGNGLVLQLPPLELSGALFSAEEDDGAVSLGQIVAPNLQIEAVSLGRTNAEFDEFFASETEVGFGV